MITNTSALTTPATISVVTIAIVAAVMTITIMMFIITSIFGIMAIARL